MSAGEISEAAKAKADELLREGDPRGAGRDGYGVLAEWVPTAFARFIQEVSDAAKETQRWLEPVGQKIGYHMTNSARERLAPFILPEPVDPAREAVRDAIQQARGGDWNVPADERLCDALLSAFKARGIEIGGGK